MQLSHTACVVAFRCGRSSAVIRSLSGRAKKKMEDLEKLLDIAVKNYTQLGGVVQDDQRQQRQQQHEQYQTTARGSVRASGPEPKIIENSYCTPPFFSFLPFPLPSPFLPFSSPLLLLHFPPFSAPLYNGFPFPFLPLPFPPFPSLPSFPPFPPPSLRSRFPLNQLGSLGERCKLPQQSPEHS